MTFSRTFPALITLFFTLQLSAESKEVTFEADIKPFLKEYCTRCHGEEKQKADRRLDILEPNFNDRHHAMLWQETLDQLNMGEMPPKKPYPQDEQLNTVITWITANMKKVREEQLAKSTGTTLRRMSHLEYSNTLKQLFKFDHDNFLLAQGLPEDKISHAFNNNADKLQFTSFLYEKYLNIADRVLDHVLHGTQAPKKQKWTLKPEQMRGGRDVPVYHQHTHGKSYADLIGRQKMTSRCWIENGFQAPISGNYVLKIKAEAINTNTKEWKKWATPKPGTPYKLGVCATSKEYGQISAPNVADYTIATPTITEGLKTYTIHAYFKQGYSPYFIWENGMNSALSGKISGIAAKEHKEAPGAYLKYGRWKSTDMFYQKGSRIRVYEVQIEGPLFKEWPPKRTQTFFPKGVPPTLSNTDYIAFLHHFAEQAWRRNVKITEIDSIVELGLKTLKQEGATSALRVGMKAILVSNGFLTVPQNDGKLNADSLASRLSYFLWKSAPDAELKQISHGQEFFETKSYRNQAERLINHTNVTKFIDDFTQQWLNFDRIAIMQPDKNKYKSYYSKGVHRYVTKEAKAFLHHLLKNNLSIYNCLDSDFLVINQNLAQHYGIKGVSGSHFREVKLPEQSIRGGLITQAAVMAATSNGVDSSPVTRGIWVLENILGTPPPPPPEDVEPLDPDIRGARTLVEQLEAHRQHNACNECHIKIDPIGMPLEVFNPVGLFRTTYGGKEKLPVLHKSTLHNGKVIESIHEYKEYLLDNKQKFAHCFVEKLLEYGTGRKMSYLEREHIENIVASLDQHDGFRDLLLKIVTSPIFLKR